MNNDNQNDVSKSVTIFDASEYLDSEEKIAAYLNVVIEDEDWDILLPSIAHVAKAHAVTRIIESHNLDRSSLYKGVRPEAVSIGAILRPLIDIGANTSPSKNRTWFSNVDSIRNESGIENEFVDVQEMDEIQANTELLLSLVQGIEDARSGSGRFLNQVPEKDDVLVPIHKLGLFQECLYEMMRSISQEVYFAGWLNDLEFRLWRIIEGKLLSMNDFDIDEDRAFKLRELSRLCGGWITFNEGQFAQWIPIDRWIILYQEWIKLKAP